MEWRFGSIGPSWKLLFRRLMFCVLFFREKTMLPYLFFFPVNGEIPSYNSMDVEKLSNHVNIVLCDYFLYRIFFLYF